MSLQRCSDPYPHWLLRDPRSGDALRLVPERGGLVSGWRCGGSEILYLDEERFADPALSVRGGIPVLFPICGNLPENTLPLPQGRFSLPQHGFARDLPWELSPLEGAAGEVVGARMELTDTQTTRASFPFRFSLVLAVVLEPSALAITVRLRHAGEPGDPPLPFSFGLHPYLAVRDPARVRLEGLPARGLDQSTGHPVDTDAALARLAGGVDLLAGPAAAVRLVDPAAGRVVTLETLPPLDLVVVWSDPPRPMVCLEPWTAPRGALISGERCLRLDPGASVELGCRYRVSPL
jgi:galactose mutarotase-like enzyme